MSSRTPPSPPQSLRFPLRDVPAEGFTLQRDVRPDELDLPPDEGVVRDKLHLECRVLNTSEGAAVTGTLAGIVARECVRCLAAYDDRLVVPFTALFQKAQDEDRPAAEDHDDAMGEDEVLSQLDEVYPCPDDHVDLAVMLREQVILATPIQRLCRESCRGLCPRCGMNWNHGSCGCPTDPETPSPWADALKHAKKRLSDC